MKKLISNLCLLTVLLLSMTQTKAQVNSYTFTASAGTYTPLATNGFAVTNGAGINGSSVCCYNIDFPFQMDGETMTQLYINYRGYIQLINGNFPSGTNATNPLGNANTRFVVSALTSTDATGGLRSYAATSEIRMATIGTTPNRVQTIEFKEFNFNPSSNGEQMNVQIKLYETSNKIEIVYGTIVKNGTVRKLQIGIKGNSNQSFKAVTANSSYSWANPLATGAIDTAVLDSAAGIVPTSGTTYTFAPAPIELGISRVVPFPFCGAATTPLNVEVSNNGSTDLMNIPLVAEVTGTINGSPYSNTFSVTHPGTIAKFTKGIVAMGNLPSTGAGAVLNVKVKVSYPADAYSGNDSMIVNNMLVNGSPQTTPPNLNFNFCGSGRKTLNSNITTTATNTAAWFASPTSTAPVAMGSNYQTPSLSAPSNTNYYYANAITSPNKSFQNAPYGGGSWYGYGITHGFFSTMTPYNNIVLERVSMYPWGQVNNQPATLTVYYRLGSWTGFTNDSNAWTKLGDIAVIIPNTGTEVIADIPDLLIPSGQITSFYMCITAGAPWDNATNGTPISNDDFSLSVGPARRDYFDPSQSGSINNNAKFRGNLYYKTFCTGPRATAAVSVRPLPVGAAIIKSTVFNGTFSGGTATFPDIVGEGDQIKYEMTAPTFSSNAQFGTQWYISGLEVKSIAGGTVNSADTATTMPSPAGNGTLSFTPSAGFADSTFRARITLTSIVSGCDSVLERFIYVAPTPDANFSAANVCEGEKVSFDNTATLARGSMSFTWYFGDGTSSTKKSPEHLYATPGIYTVSMVAVSQYGYKDSVAKTVEVFEKPGTNFTFTNVCEGDSIVFAGPNNLPAGFPTYSWDFGGLGTSTSGTPKFMFATPGEHDVKFKVTVNGCQSDLGSKLVTQFERAQVALTGTADCSNEPVQFNNNTTISSGRVKYTWNFGDNNSTIASAPSHLYAAGGTYDVTLIAETEFGCIDSAKTSVTTQQSPVAGYTVAGICSDEETVLTNTTVEPVGANMSYSWNLGNGNIVSSKDVQFTYLQGGTYNVSLIAISNNNCVDSFKTVVTIGTKPTAAFVAANACMGDVLSFQNATTGIGNILYSWNFGDGTTAGDTSIVKDPSYNYTTAGSYNVVLMANNNGCIDTAQSTLQVFALPSAAFTVTRNNPTGNFGLAANNLGLTKYRWSLGDGGFSTSNALIYQYFADGLYPIELTVTDNNGCSSTSKDTVTVFITSIGDLPAALQLLKAYPNPNTGSFTVDLGQVTDSPVTILVTDMVGKHISTANIAAGNEKALLDLAAQAPGVYLVKVTRDGAVATLRVSIAR